MLVHVENPNGSKNNCFIDERHFVVDMTVTEVRGESDESNACDIGDKILPGQVAESFEKDLDTVHEEWEKVLKELERVIGENRDDIFVTQIDEEIWAPRVGIARELLLNRPGANFYSIYNSAETEHGTMPYGVDTCQLKSGILEGGTRLAVLGDITYKDKAQVLTIVYELSTGIDNAVYCKPGDLVLIPKEKLTRLQEDVPQPWGGEMVSGLPAVLPWVAGALIVGSILLTAVDTRIKD